MSSARRLGDSPALDPTPRQGLTYLPLVSCQPFLQLSDLRMGAAARRSLRARRFTGECGVLSGAPVAWGRH
jgi:hypothetical protein